eukprot:680565-Rhodomonas_salina.1
MNRRVRVRDQSERPRQRQPASVGPELHPAHRDRNPPPMRAAPTLLCRLVLRPAFALRRCLFPA